LKISSTCTAVEWNYPGTARVDAGLGLRSSLVARELVLLFFVVFFFLVI
jgi:hypothetical protein